MNQTSSAALTLSLFLLDNMRASGSLSQEVIDNVLSGVIANHALQGEEPETQILRTKLLAKMSEKAANDIRERIG
jgi:hypothetical protein